MLGALNHPTNSITIGAINSATYVVGVRARNASGDSGWRNSPPAGPFQSPTPTSPTDTPPGYAIIGDRNSCQRDAHGDLARSAGRD